MSEYEKLEKQYKDYLKAVVCDTCGGSGKLDDTDPVGIYYNEIICPTCHGVGMLDQDN